MARREAPPSSRAGVVTVDVNVPRDRLVGIGDGRETNLIIDADELRAWFEERITSPDHRNYLLPAGWTRKTGEFYDATNYEGPAQERLRPVWDSLWKHVPEIDQREFPAYGPQILLSKRRSVCRTAPSTNPRPGAARSWRSGKTRKPRSQT